MGKRRAKAKKGPPEIEDAQPNDCYEAEAPLPVEEQSKNVNKRYDIADGLDFELPSDVSDDEEIDEDMAFTKEEKRQFAGMFGDDGNASFSSDQADEHLLEEDASDVSEAAEFDADDSSDEQGQSTGEQSDEEDEDARHQAMLEAVSGGAGKRKRKRTDVVVTEAYPESEYNLNPMAASAGGAQGDLQLSDLMNGLGESKRKLGPVRKVLERLERKGVAVPAPLPGNVQARQERKAAYDVTSKDVTKWQAMVKANREAPTLAFSKPRGAAGPATTTAALTAQFQPQTDMEAEVAAMLRSAGVDSGKAVQEGEDALALKELSAEETATRRNKLAKMRALLFYHEQKAKHVKAIKSKEYRRKLNKAARRKARDGAGAEGDSAALRAAAEDAEFERAKERLTLKHKNTSKWARRALKRGINVRDDSTKEAMEEQLRLGQQLRQKVERPPSSSSDSDGSTSASDSEGERDGNDAAPRPAKPPRDHYRRSRAAALDVLNGAGDSQGDGSEGKGLFGLPFMRRAKEQQQRASAAEAAAVLRSIEAEMTGLPEDEAEAGQPAPANGRFTFGAAFNAAATPAVEDSGGDGGSGGELEDAEAEADRLTRQRQSDAAMDSAGVSQPLHPLRADAVAVDPPSSRAHTSGARPSSDGFTSALHIGSQAVAAAADSGGMRSERAFGASPGPGSVGAAPAPSSLLQPRETDRLTDPAPANGITIGPASRVTRGSLSKSAAQQQQQQQAPASSSDDHRGSSPELEAPADAMQPMQGSELTQEQLVSMAFAGDDVTADFAAQKAEEAAEEAPPVELHVGLPGWGSWANPHRMAREATAAAQKAKQQKEAALAKRRDAGKASVVVTEKWDRKSQRYAATAVPFPFDSRDTYERSLRQPLGHDFNTNASFRNLTRPAVIKDEGLIIQPLKYSQGCSDKTTGGLGGGQLKGGQKAAAKGATAPPRQRARVKVISAGRPR